MLGSYLRVLSKLCDPTETRSSQTRKSYSQSRDWQQHPSLDYQTNLAMPTRTRRSPLQKPGTDSSYVAWDQLNRC
jgi:hypothetical protein